MTCPDGVLTGGSLKKLTVPQLRAICKEKRITGYGKIPKDAIISKILLWQQSAIPSPPTTVQQPLLSGEPPVHRDSPSSNVAGSSAAVTESNIQLNGSSQSESRKPQKISGHRTHPAEPTPTTSRPANTAAGRGRPTETSQNQIAAHTNHGQALPLPRQPSGLLLPAQNRPPDGSVSPALGPKRPLIEAVANTAHVAPRKKSKHNLPLMKPPPTSPHKYPGNKQHIQITREKPPTVQIGPKKRFLPLVRASRAFPAHPVHTHTQEAQSARSIAIPERSTSRSRGEAYPPLQFDTSAFEIPLKSIRYPPSLSQRKRIPRLALILSEISYSDLKACAIVSRSFRYAAYLAAARHLQRHFPGKRTNEMLARYPMDRTDFWPYLLYRQEEAARRRRIYEDSFLGRAHNGTLAISKKLWTSPDDEKQANIAVKFLLTKLFFHVSIGSEDGRNSPRNKAGTVLNAEQVIPNEIWRIFLLSEGSTHTFYILEATCEVIGQGEASGSNAPSGDLRADWMEYVAAKTSPSSGPECDKCLWDKISWTNHEEYDRGISRHWLSRTAKEGAAGHAKLEVARRYIFACVVSNSLSGAWQSSSEMCQDFNGSRTLGPTPVHKAQRVNLFLPAHHHVESVHFDLGRGRPLHPALAVIQTPAREYYVLKDNGMQVGCEEDGIAPIWKQINEHREE